MNDKDFQKARFLTSCAHVQSLPPERGIEIALAGRSNVGKSSALNLLCNSKGLAKTSSVPGKTRHINLFAILDDLHIVDLPGYGYAKVPEKEKKRWGRELAKYILERKCLRGIILLMDIRHPLTELDRGMLNLAIEGEREIHIVLSKADKLSKGQRLRTFSEMSEALTGLPIPWSLQLLSSPKKEGLQELRLRIRSWYKA